MYSKWTGTSRDAKSTGRKIPVSLHLGFKGATHIFNYFQHHPPLMRERALEDRVILAQRQEGLQGNTSSTA